ncbi:MAG: type III pantothenate kinase [Methylococcales bacterium]
MKKQNILLVDAGNSSVKWSMTDTPDTNELSQMQQKFYPENISISFFTQCWGDLEKPERVVVSCVADKKVLYALNKACDQLWGIKVKEINSLKEASGFVNAYIEPSDLGSDRWCAMIGANEKISSDFIVVDCGSAITIDLVTSHEKNVSRHLGGYILPGLEMMKRSLGTQTADVKVDLEHTKITLSPSNTTIGCVNSAVYLSAIKLIETVFEQQVKQNGGVQCLLTGGDAPLLAEFLSFDYTIMPDLVLRGLSVIDTARLENKNN